MKRHYRLIKRDYLLSEELNESTFSWPYVLQVRWCSLFPWHDINCFKTIEEADMFLKNKHDFRKKTNILSEEELKVYNYERN